MGGKKKSGSSRNPSRVDSFANRSNYLNYLGFDRPKKNKKPKWIGRFGRSSCNLVLDRKR